MCLPGQQEREREFLASCCSRRGRCGGPVVAQRNCVAFTDLVQDGVNGYLAEGPHEVRRRIEEYLGDPALAARHASAGYEGRPNVFSWSSLAGSSRRDTVRMRLQRQGAGMKTFHPIAWHAHMTPTEQILWQLQNRDVHDRDVCYFRRFLGSDGLFVDVGANRGQSAVFCSKWYGPNVRSSRSKPNRSARARSAH
jgi:hypothetical protein